MVVYSVVYFFLYHFRSKIMRYNDSGRSVAPNERHRRRPLPFPSLSFPSLPFPSFPFPALPFLPFPSLPRRGLRPLETLGCAPSAEACAARSLIGCRPGPGRRGLASSVPLPRLGGALAVARRWSRLVALGCLAPWLAGRGVPGARIMSCGSLGWVEGGEGGILWRWEQLESTYYGESLSTE